MEHLSRALVVASLLVLVSPARAQPNPWPFDFDTSIAEDPAGVDSRISELAEGVPPVPAGDLVPTDVGPVTFYFHAPMLELLERAFRSGPGLQTYFQRTPTLCAAHASFTFPDLLVSGASVSCQQKAQRVRADLLDDEESCLRIEFPELYIYDQTPGEAATEDLQSLEGLIRIAGEVFTHIDYPSGLLPDDFETQTRNIIAKVRYDTLRANVDERRAAYAVALETLQMNAACFAPSAAASLSSTVTALVDELDAAEASLEALYADGLEQAAADRAAVTAAGRHRSALPYPALTDHERELLALYIGGIYWRMRGEALLTYPESGLLRRLLYTQYPYQVIADLTGGVDGADFGRDIFIHETWGYADWMDIGHNPGPGNDKYSDMVDMAKRGKRTLDLAAPRLEARGFDNAYLYAGGLQMGPCYYYAWEPLWDDGRLFQVGEDLVDPYVWFLESPTAHGEFCTGGALGLGLARALLNGKPGVVDEGDDDGDGAAENDNDGTASTTDAGADLGDVDDVDEADDVNNADAGPRVDDEADDEADDETDDEADDRPFPGAAEDADAPPPAPNASCTCVSSSSSSLVAFLGAAFVLVPLLRRRREPA